MFVFVFVFVCHSVGAAFYGLPSFVYLLFFHTSTKKICKTVKPKQLLFVCFFLSLYKHSHRLLLFLYFMAAM